MDARVVGCLLLYMVIGGCCGYLIGSQSDGESRDHVVLCYAHCDVLGYYKPAFYCMSEDKTQDVYCCGSEFDRYCCTDKDKDVGDLYPNVKTCPNSSYWGYQWRVIMGLLGTLILLLSFAACCYYCCGAAPAPAHAQQRRVRRIETDATGQPVPDDINIHPEEFDPESQYAFSPPEYDSLPKDPPKYLDIFNQEGQENPAFQSDGDGVDKITSVSSSHVITMNNEETGSDVTDSHDVTSGSTNPTGSDITSGSQVDARGDLTVTENEDINGSNPENNSLNCISNDCTGNIDTLEVQQEIRDNDSDTEIETCHSRRSSVHSESISVEIVSETSDVNDIGEHCSQHEQVDGVGSSENAYNVSDVTAQTVNTEHKSELELKRKTSDLSEVEI